MSPNKHIDYLFGCKFSDGNCEKRKKEKSILLFDALGLVLKI